MADIPVVDLFAGPGGLGEGFASVRDEDGQNTFSVNLSVEMDTFAHQTLELRSFFRSFAASHVPTDYYDYLAGKLGRDELFSRWTAAARHAKDHAWLAELGSESVRESLVDERIARAIGPNHKWVLIGGPPCQAYSLAGRVRVIGGHGLKKYEADPRHRLYRHYLRILAVHRPPVFVMENVKGLLSARLKKEQTIERILADLRHPLEAVPSLGLGSNTVLEYRLLPLTAAAPQLLGEYPPEAFVVRAEDYGVPQARHRLIILGVRSDVDREPKPLRKRRWVTTGKAIGDLPRVRSGLSREADSAAAWVSAIREIAGAAWLQNGCVQPGLRRALLEAVGRLEQDLRCGQRYLDRRVSPMLNPEWFADRKLKGVCNHESRLHMRSDLHRYFYAAVHAAVAGRSPRLVDFPKALLPAHRNVGRSEGTPMFNDRFRVQVADRPSTTVVSHIAKDGHYYIHYDPMQCRCLTVREAARLQTFPDNYFFEGPRTEQYRQVGNAVPPYLAKQIAQVVAGLLE